MTDEAWGADEESWNMRVRFQGPEFGVVVSPKSGLPVRQTPTQNISPHFLKHIYIQVASPVPLYTLSFSPVPLPASRRFEASKRLR